ncbi:hypothetical protein K1719_032326 [Acacia pycnantha]|nr:hypothetical protein K1719_032326 [Acacia pycnantha]
MSAWPSIEQSPQGNTLLSEIHQQQSPPPPLSDEKTEKMVKFSRQFEDQLIPEWKDAFVDYWQLKMDLKKIQLHNGNTNNTPNKDQISFFSSLKNYSLFGHHQHNRNHGPIHVHRKLAGSTYKGDMYETELLEQFADTDATKEFFACLDQQLNKVNKFYRTKEEEFMDRGESLKKQMDILLELKSEFNKKAGSSQDSKEDQSISCTFSSEEDSIRSRAEQDEMEENSTDDSEKNDTMFTDSPRSGDDARKPVQVKKEDGKLRTLSGGMVSSQGKNVRINIPLTTPSRTLSAISYLVREDFLNQSSRKCGPDGSNKLHLNKTKLHHAEKMIKRGLMELYKGLGYLKVYRNLNMLAFIKILKKFDKVTEKEILPIYLKVVESSYFNSSDKVMKLADEVEDLFTNNFAQDDRRKAMKYLRPIQRKESHAVTFFIGLFAGCLLALSAGYVVMAHITGLYRRHQQTSVYMETVYPVLSMFSLVFLHFFLYGCNIFAWRKTRINYSFIFELSPTKELKLFLCPSSSHSWPTFTGLFTSTCLPLQHYLPIKPLPLPMCNKEHSFVTTLQGCDAGFFMADQLCSQVPMLRNLEYVACYYMTGSYKTQDYGYCMRAKHYRDLAYAVSFLPYYWRAMQCARRYFDEGQTSHLVNLGKYVSAMLAAGAKVAYEKDRSVGWLCVVVIISSAATLYQLYWDFVKDWGLLQLNSKNPWLRNELMLRRKFVYYLSMGLNLILRLAWLQTVVHSSFENVDYRVTTFFLASLEVIRRGLWNFFRLENEHLNNAGKFRAVKTVPLPFHEVDEED